jgi:hypothetical protein
VNQVKDSPRSASYQGRASMDHQNVPPVPQGHHRDVSKEAPLQTEESERGRPATNQKKNVDHAQARDIAVQSGEPLRPRAGTNSEDEAERGRKINPRNRIPEVNARNVLSARTHPHRCVKRNLPTHLLEMGTMSIPSMIRRYGRRERTYPAWVEND